MAAWLAFFSIAARLMPLPRVLRLTDARRRGRGEWAPEVIARLVDRLHPICWKRAAVLRRQLLLNGIETQIVFGVRKETDRPFGGHAWLERDGRPFLEATAPDFVVTFRYPA